MDYLPSYLKSRFSSAPPIGYFYYVINTGKTSGKLNPIPEGIPLHPNNRNLNHKIIPKKISLKLRENPEKIHLRMCTLEHPFGAVKWYGGAHFVLCKGTGKVTGEIGLSFLAYNLRRAINMIRYNKLRKLNKG